MYTQDSFSLFVVECTTYQLSCVANPTGNECDMPSDATDTSVDDTEYEACETCNFNGCQPEAAVQGFSGALHMALSMSATIFAGLILM